MFYRNWVKSRQSLKPSQSYGDGRWASFEESRKKHNENVCSETNKLVLRLDRLVNSSENGQNPDLDKSVVEWTSDHLVKLCPFCAKQFTIARRRHHCRACGAILCNSCSRFLDQYSACKLVKPAKLYVDPYDRIEDRLEQAGQAEDKPSIRVCEDCHRLLEKRIQTIEDHYCQPAFMDLYERLRRQMAEADELMLSHRTLASSSSFDASRSGGQLGLDLELKGKIQDLKQSVATLSTKLKKMSERETGKQAYLLEAISQSVAHWLRESADSKLNRALGRRVQSVDSGWVAESRPGGGPLNASGLADQSLADDESADPLLIQINNLEEYIRQAKLADRYEEVGALEESKRDLEIEYYIQQQQLQQQEEPPPPLAEGDGADTSPRDNSKPTTTTAPANDDDTRQGT